VEVRAEGGEESLPMDPMFVEACEPGSVVVEATLPESETPLYSKAEGVSVLFSRPLSKGEVVRVTVSGVRAGFGGVRLPTRTREQAEENARRWD